MRKPKKIMVDSQLLKKTEKKLKSLLAPQKTDNQAPLVLIVEDDADSRFMLKYLLGMWKYQVVEAEDGAEAVKLAEQMNPDLILMDVKLPDMDGFAVTRRIRKLAALKEVPIIFLSGYAQGALGVNAQDVGGNGYFVKPVGANELENTLGKYFGK